MAKEEVTKGKYRLTPHEKVHGRIPQLHKADIILIRHKKNLFRHFLRKATDSYWDHSALVLYARFRSKSRHHTVLIESIRSGLLSGLSSRGVSLHRIKKYLMDPKKYEVGIKRVPGFTGADRDRVRLFMLMNVDAPYWPWKYVGVTLAALFPSRRAALLRKQRFSCSSLIQKAFYDSMPSKEKARVVFKLGTWSPVELQELVNPGDIARSENAKWVYNEK